MKKIIPLLAVAAALTFACKKKEAETAKPAASPAAAATTAAPAATAAPATAAATKAGGKIESKSGSKVTGTADLAATADGKTAVTVKVAGASKGLHGVHVHDKGDCSDAEAKNAGPHFNPGAGTHGGPTTATHHAGDLGNMTVAADGTGTLTITVPVKLDDLVGKSIVVHEKEDDMKTDPSGNSGARQGCAVISKM